MSPWDVVLVAWVVGLVAFLGGAAWGRAVGRGAALADAASCLEDEACRCMLHGFDLAGAAFFRLAVEIRELADAPAGDRFKGPAPAGTTASKADGARLDTSGAR